MKSRTSNTTSRSSSKSQSTSQRTKTETDNKKKKEHPPPPTPNKGKGTRNKNGSSFSKIMLCSGCMIVIFFVMMTHRHDNNTTTTNNNNKHSNNLHQQHKEESNKVDKIDARVISHLLFQDTMSSANSDITEPRQLDGTCNRMPRSDTSGPPDYVKLGEHNTWPSSHPISLTIDSIGTKEVVKEERGYMSRGWILTGRELNGSVELGDGSKVSVAIKVMKVY